MTTRQLVLAALLSCSLALASGCAPTATAHGMAIVPADLKGTASPTVASAIAVGRISGKPSGGLGEPYIDDAPFRQALEESLRVAGLLSERPDAPLSVDATVVSLDTSMGFDMKARSIVHYVVRERRTGAVVIDEQIAADHTATMGDAFFGQTRARLALEGSARKNIAALVQRLNTIRKNAPAPAAGGSPAAAVPST